MIRRIFVEKKKEYAHSEKKLLSDINTVLNIKASDVKIFLRYDIENIDDNVYKTSLRTIFSESVVDDVYEEELPTLIGYKLFVSEYLPGQYDQRADSAEQCVALLSMSEKPLIRCAVVYAIKNINDNELKNIKTYLINPVESREGTFDKPKTLADKILPSQEVKEIENFINFNKEQIKNMYDAWGLAMSLEDLEFVQQYFKNKNRNATETEIKVIDTYWSDHCRHTTFNTELIKIDIKSENPHIQKALDKYNILFDEHYKNRPDKYKSLMSIATIIVKELVKKGYLDNLDVSEEINACSIKVKVDNNGVDEDWLVMFKNETHNHPTEIEPFGGAATCLGGAIRDPLSGRTYVYQAMRVTGSADPTVPLNETIKGKLPQRVITKTAAHGYSSYGNQIGLATGLVAEMYHEKYVAKRLETGFVIAGAPEENVKREVPKEGDIVILLGGATGRDGCGGATGSSKSHDVKSVETSGAEVQKGNPTIERKIQRLFRNKEAANYIIRCNDFGAGGVSVAIGELSEGLDIYLDRVPKKYAGLSGTEIAISESQERMAVVVKKENAQRFIDLARQENLNAVEVANITSLKRMRMFLNDRVIVDLERSFLDTNGVKQTQKVLIEEEISSYMLKVNKNIREEIKNNDYKQAVLKELSRLNVCSTKGLGEMFDSTIGAASVLMPFGGKKQLTQSIVMAAKLPVIGHTNTATVSSYACYPYLMDEAPFIGAIYSIVASISKLIASGVELKTIRLTLQEYFKKLGKDEKRWGEPTRALLGAFLAQFELKVAAIGGKDSMSGSFENIDVVPTLISFAVGVIKADKLIHNTFKYSEDGYNYVYRLSIPKDKYSVPDFKRLLDMYDLISTDIKEGKIVAATVVEEGGALISIIKSIISSSIGFNVQNINEELFYPSFGDIIVVSNEKYSHGELIGQFITQPKVLFGIEEISLDELEKSFTKTLDKVFPVNSPAEGEVSNLSFFGIKKTAKELNIVQPRVFIPVFPGTNCEYDTARAFQRAGAKVSTLVIRNQNPQDIEESVERIIDEIKKSQIIAFPGGFSGGDEPDGSGKFIATTFRNPKIKDVVEELLKNRDGLAIGICNGFQALIKLGLVPYGEIIEQSEKAPTLTFNNISRHISTISRIRVATNKTPWFNSIKVGDIFNVAISHGEGRFVSSSEELEKLIKAGQVATQYVDKFGNATMESPYNPNGSIHSIEGIISPDGHVLGKMGHAERIDDNLYKNVEGNYDMKLFESGVNYFK